MQNLPQSFSELLISPPVFVKSPFPKDGIIWFVTSANTIVGFNRKLGGFVTPNFPEIVMTVKSLVQVFTLELQEFYIHDVRQGFLSVDDVPVLFCSELHNDKNTRYIMTDSSLEDT
jgi:hypothetical protein